MKMVEWNQHCTDLSMLKGEGGPEVKGFIFT